ncbi:hypothetical protein D4T97_004725 [Siminovitchia acidinfaciens]|uniref:Uncharacterized protein n=1 Tax=Siminovitchia acidinfaciens TaxID=2321395 RepID=A0A429Y3X7_9BACI|nr:hypothetical protein [Siminovitchia acidinfaciens]RST76098.1 hypothetical protein D4T97_004725 [Siminovitchia acidinfaciens]
MSKKMLVALFWLGVVGVVFISLSRPGPSLEEKICARLTAQYGDCQNIIFFDGHSNLVFAESDLGIMPVLMDKELTEIVKVIHPLDFQEYKEHNRPIAWQADNNLQKDLSMISGFADNTAKTIIINSEGGVQPNKFFIRDNLWFWYVTFKNKVILPADVTAYDEKGDIVYSGDEEE